MAGRRRFLSWLMAPLIWVERARGRWRLALLAVYLLIAAMAAAFLFRATRLAGLPEIGVPFDPEPLRSLSVPADRNAAVLYREANARLVRNHEIERAIFKNAYAWPVGNTEALNFLASNEAAIDLWRRGSEQPDSMSVPLDSITLETLLPDIQAQRPCYWHALTRAAGARLGGDMAGAWGWYRAILRASRHSGKNTPAIGRIVGASHLSGVVGPIAAWAADPRVDGELLRRALADVREVDAMTAPLARTIEIDFLAFRATLSDPEAVRRLLDDSWGAREMNLTDWRTHLPGARRVEWFLQDEPVRSRRIAALALANWLAQADQPASRRPPLVGTARNPALLFDAPSARDLAAQLETAMLAPSSDLLTYATLFKTDDRDRQHRAALIRNLAAELDRRDHGQPPASPAAVVGPHLNTLPDAGPNSP